MIPLGGENLRGEPLDFRIPRTGDRDLAFRGWLLSHAEERGGSPALTRGVDIDIYLTIRLRLVAHLCRWSLRDAEGLREEHRVAGDDPAARVLDWLKQESSGRLDATAKAPWGRAGAAWAGPKREAVERVD